MARIRFKKPKIAILMSEVIATTVWLFLGDQITNILDSLVGDTYSMNLSTIGELVDQGGCTNDTVFEDAFQILGIGYDCGSHTATNPIESVANTSDGLLGVVGLVMVVMILMNFITYN